MCCGEYRTSSLTWRFDNIFITMSPQIEEHRDAPWVGKPRVGDRNICSTNVTIRDKFIPKKFGEYPLN